MPAGDVLKNFNLFVDGRGHAGQIEEYSPPTLTIATEDFRAGGMDAPAPIDMGMEALETSFRLRSFDADVLAQFGVAEGAWVGFTARGALENHDGTVKAIVHTMRGRITSLEQGTWSGGQPTSLGVTMKLIYYRLEIDKVVIHEIDVENMVRVVNGTDRLAAQRAALGI